MTMRPVWDKSVAMKIDGNSFQNLELASISNYLGLPLRTGKILKIDWQPMLDKIDKKLAVERFFSLVD